MNNDLVIKQYTDWESSPIQSHLAQKHGVASGEELWCASIGTSNNACMCYGYGASPERAVKSAMQVLRIRIKEASAQLAFLVTSNAELIEKYGDL